MSAHKYSQPLYSPFKQQMRFQERKEEYELLLEFQLKRQKQKNVILEQRLRNKQMFIQQMKIFNQDITTTFERCQEQLNICRTELNHIKNFEVRDHFQQIAHLKHQIKKLEQENHRGLYSRGTIVYSNNQGQRNMSQHNSRMKGYAQSHGSQKQTPKSRSKRSKSKASQVPGHKKSEQGQFNEDKLLNFINQFLKMANYYVQINQNEKLTSKLKTAWKWIRRIVKQWHQNKDRLQKNLQFIQNLQRVLNMQQNEKGQAELQLSQMLSKITKAVQKGQN